MIKRGKILILSVIFLLLLAACGNTAKQTSPKEEVASEEASNKGTIEMQQINWAENIAVTNMWKVILEDKGYTVNFNLLDMGIAMTALSEDELDVSPEIWLPVQDAVYLEKYKDEVNFSENSWYDNAKVGLVVPSYMEDVNSIEELNEHKEEFDSKITGFEPGAGTMVVTKEEVIKDYDLDFTLLPSSEPAMIAELEKAISKKEGIVVPLWSPHRVFSEMDLKYLEDPKNVYGDTEKIYHATRLGFAEDYPEVSEWFNNWKMDDDAIGQLMSYVGNAEEPIDGARKWVEENQDLINKWVK